MRRSFFLIGVLLFVSTHAQCQTWKLIGNLPPTTDLRCAYFWDTAHGVVGGVGCIYTYNSGVWAQATYPEAIDTIKSLRLLDGVNLYAASGAFFVWKSTDRGATWQKTTSILPNADDIYLDADGMIHGLNLYGAEMMQGTSFARINALDCAVTKAYLTTTAYSLNGAISWSSSASSFLDGYNIAADSCTGIFYTVSQGLKPEFWESTDRGKTWDLIYDFGPNSGVSDILEGANYGVLYVQTTQGVLRYSPAGVWQPIGGPDSPFRDRRMFGFGLYNRYLIDMVGGAVWLWNDSSSIFILTNPIASININRIDCDSADLTLDLPPPDFVDTLHIRAFTTDGTLLSPEDTTIVDSGNSLHYVVTLPKGRESGTIYFDDSSTGGSECYPAISWDTSYSFNLLPGELHASLPSTVRLGYCQDVRVPLIVAANLCDTGLIDSIQLQASGGTFSIEDQLPAVVNPGQADTFWITGSGFHRGQYTLRVRVAGTSFSLTGSFDTTLTLQVTVTGSDEAATITLKNLTKISDCTPARFPLSITALSCDTLWIDSLTFHDTIGRYSVNHYPPDTILPNNRDTFWISTEQMKPGAQFGVVQIYGRSYLTGTSFDTSFVISYTVVPDPSVPRVTAHNLTVSNCKTSTVPIVLQADPCDSTEFTGCTLTLNGINYSTDLTFPIYLPPGVSDTMLISIPPQSLSGVYTVSAEVKGKYLGSIVSFDATAQMLVTFTNASSALVPNPDGVNFNTFSLCNKRESDTTIMFTNLGCDTMTVTGDQTVWQNGWSASDPTFPFFLPPDDSFAIVFHFIPTGFTFTNQPVTYGYEYEGGKIGTVQLTLTGQATPASVGFAITDTAINFGTFSQCGTPVADTTLTITNSGCDTLALSGASVDPGAGFALVNGADTTLAPNESAIYSIDFIDSIPGSFHSAFHITGVGTNGGTTIDTSVSLTAAITAGTRLATINTTAIDFGTTSICEERDSSVTITNTGCEPIAIAGNTFSSPQFADTNSFPIILLPDSSATFPIFTHLDTTGHPDTINGTLNFTLDSGATVPSVTLTRAVTYPVEFSLSLAAQASAPINATVPVYVLLHGTIPSQADEVDFDLVYNDDLLSYQNPLQPDIMPNGPTTVVNGITDRPFKMLPGSDRDTIATLQFQTYLTKNDSTSIRLTHQQFLADREISPPCIATIDTISIPSHFTLELGCDDSNIMAALNDSLPFIIESIQPNPAQNEITVTLLGTVQPTIEIYDVLGRTVAIFPPSSFIPHHSFFSVDVSNVPSGVYYLRLTSNGYVQTRSISVER
jgi:hypothetical protein